MDMNKDDALARRRAQNRLAQRRFRWKQGQQKVQVQAQSVDQQPEQHENNNADDSDPRRNDARLATASSAQHLPTTVWTVPPSIEPSRPSPGDIFDVLEKDLAKSPATSTSSNNQCRFSLFGNASLLGSHFWATEDGAATTKNNELALPSTSLVQISQQHVSLEDMSMEDPEHGPALRSSLEMGPQSTTYPAVHSDTSEALEDLINIDPKFSTTAMRSPQANRSRSHSKSISNNVELSSPSINSQSRTTSTWATSTSPDTTDGSIWSSSGIPGSANWQSSLHIAAQKGHERITRLLLQHEIGCNEEDSDGHTPLYYAIKGGHEGIVISLIDHGAPLDWVDSQRRNALHWAVLERRDGILRALLRRCAGNQAIINAYDDTGMTPLHTAVDNGFEAGVQLLLEHGADLNYRAQRK